jgi:hypothetical protein
MIAGMMSLGASRCGGQFPLWQRCLESLRDLCDVLVVRWDTHTGDPAVRDLVPQICGAKLHTLILGRSKWNPYNWRESMLREVHKLAPTLVLTPDQDEEFGPEIREDLAALLASDRQALMFRYEMLTVDGACVPMYPRLPHMKAFKWRPDLTYRPYKYCAIVTNYAGRRYQLAARSRMRHLCYFTPELRAQRRLVRKPCSST